MINFTVGPVQSPENVLYIGAQQVPYFRTSDFSEIMFENECLMKQCANAADDARVIFITGSGTASMEAAVMNTLSPKDKALVVNGGSFGRRFADLLSLHGIPHDEIKLSVGKTLRASMLEPYEGKGYTAFLVNVHETSTGVHYDMNLISEFCKRNHLFLIVDAISSFLADEFKMKDWGVDVMLTGSQKALACPPGISIMVLSQNAIDRVEHTNCKCMYLDIKNALYNAERGQTPFTPAVGILLQIHERLCTIVKHGGVEKETMRIAEIATDFREKIKDLPFEIISESLSNAVTPLHPLNVSAYSIFMTLKVDYAIWVCPNGGELKDFIFRVGHIGALTKEDNTVLVNAFRDMRLRGLL